MAKVRFQMFLDKKQKEMLERIHKNHKIPLAEIIRRAIDKFLAEWKKTKVIPAGDEMTERFLSVAGICMGGPRDLADKHDRYLYGVSRR